MDAYEKVRQLDENSWVSVLVTIHDSATKKKTQHGNTYLLPEKIPTSLPEMVSNTIGEAFAEVQCERNLT